MTDREKRQWKKIRAKGFSRYMLVRGLLIYGLIFAVGMTAWQIFSRGIDNPQKDLINFFLYIVTFGGFMGFTTWLLNENDYQKPSESDDED